MITRPFLTIVTVTFNAGALLEGTLESVVRAQKELPEGYTMEYLLIDGASTDHTLEVAMRYRDALDMSIYSERDKGLYDAMNKGTNLATGKYLWFLNAGDEVHDDTVLRRLSIATASDADVYYSDALFISPEGDALGLRSNITPHTLPEHISWRDMAMGMKICHQAFIVKRALAPVYEINNLSADLDWEIVALKKAGNTERLDFVLCRYLLGGISTQRHWKSLSDRWLVLKRHFGWAAALYHHVRIAVRGGFFMARKGKYW